jgi:hypothetical protein
MTRDQELWAMALWVEKHHGQQGRAFISDQIARLASAGEPDGVAMWCQVAQRLQSLGRDGQMLLSSACDDKLH